MAQQSVHGRVAAARARASARLAVAQDRSAVARAGVFAYQRDRQVAGGVLAGALAYRLFAALLPIALLAAVLIGWLGGRDGTALNGAASDAGVSTFVVESVASASRVAETQRWVLIGFSLVTIMLSAYAAVKAIRSSYALAWDMPIERCPRPLAAALALLGSVLAVFMLWALSAWAREQLGFAGILIAVCAAAAAFFALCLAACELLPHRPVSRKALVPGAALMAAGLQVMHLVTTVWLAHKIQTASATYGTLGAAFALLVWLYFISRLIVAGAVLNAALAGVEPGRGSSTGRGSPRG
jgi:membrane protein